MSTLETLKTASSSGRAAVAVRARDILMGAKALVRAWVNRRRAMRTLGSMDARALADIGLTPFDVQSAFAERVYVDPTRRLAVLAVERRAAIRATARERVARLGDADGEGSNSAAPGSIPKPSDIRRSAVGCG